MKALIRAECLALAFLALILESLFLSLRFLGDLSGHVVATVTLYLSASLFYIVSSFLILKVPSGRKARYYSSLTALVLLAAIVFRLTVWPLFPALSDDVFRYRWEGKLQAAGGNPYQSRPVDPELSHLRDETFPRIPARDFRAGYGPLVERIEGWTHRVSSSYVSDAYAQAFWHKLPAALFDLGVIAALCGLLASRGLPVERVLVYAWSPLPVMEFWATGHNDSIAIFFVVLALLLAARERWNWSFASLSLAAAAKLWPALLFPLFIGWSGRRPLRWHQWLIGLPVFAAMAWPYRSDVSENIRFVSGFLGGWRNNDSLFGILLWAAGDQYLAKYSAFAIVFGAAAFVTLRRWPLERASLAVVAVMLMVSANCHPWYLSWMLPLLAFAPLPPLLLWTALMPLAYEVLLDWLALGEWRGSTPGRWYIYVPVYGMLAGHWLLRLWRRRTAAGRCDLPVDRG